MRVKRPQMGSFARRTLVGAACAFSAAFAAPAFAAAAASDVSISSTLKTVTVKAATNTTNAVTVSADVPGDKILIHDSAGVATNDVPCAAAGPGTISCPLAALTKIEVSLGNQNDQVTIAPGVPAKIPTSLDGSTGNDLFTGGPGADSISGSSGNDSESGGPGADTFRGGSGFDIASYQDHAGGVTASIGGKSKQDGNGEDGPPGAADTINSDIEAIIGGPGADFLVGDKHNNSLLGMAGADFLIGEAGDDYENGGDGIDFVAGNTGGDFLDGGPDPDVLRGNRDNDFLYAVDGTRDLSLRCGPGLDRLRRDSIDPRGKSCRPHRRHRHHRR
jgi:Ca2+-binding RTX toxin-like protein